MTTKPERPLRIIGLAKLIWPEAKQITVRNGLGGGDPYTAYVRVDDNIVIDIDAPNERAYDALEAALLVLQCERSEELVEKLRELAADYAP